MKKFHYCIVLLALSTMLSCSTRELDENTSLCSSNSSPTKAVILDSSFTSEFDFSVQEKDIWAFVERQKGFPQIISIEPRLRGKDTLLFVAHLEKGWRVFSADKHLPPVVAEIPEGFFNQQALENPGLRGWMESIMDLTCELKQEKELSSATDYTDLWEGYQVSKKEGKPAIKGLSQEPTWTRVILSQQTTFDVTPYGPLLLTKWGQRNPWNISLPLYQGTQRHPTGCAAVAISQLLYYYHNTISSLSGLYQNITITDWQYHTGNPPYYTSTLSRINYQDPSSLWAQMPKDSTEYSINYPASLVGASYVSDLMVDVGNRASIHYFADGSGSGTNVPSELPALTSFGLSYSHGSFDVTTAYAEIVNSRPILLNGFDSIHYSPEVGHAWVIDGVTRYRYITYTTYQWLMGYHVGSLPNGEEMTFAQAQEAAWSIGLDKPEDGMITYETSYTEPYYKFHMNWGWNGESDGLYYYNDLVLHNGHYYQLTSNQSMTYGFHASALN